MYFQNYYFEVIYYIKNWDDHCSIPQNSYNFCETVFYIPCMSSYFIFPIQYLYFPHLYSLNLKWYTSLDEYLSFLQISFFTVSSCFQNFIFQNWYLLIDYLLIRVIRFHKIHLTFCDYYIRIIQLYFLFIFDGYYFKP